MTVSLSIILTSRRLLENSQPLQRIPAQGGHPSEWTDFGLGVRLSPTEESPLEGNRYQNKADSPPE